MRLVLCVPILPKYAAWPFHTLHSFNSGLISRGKIRRPDVHAIRASTRIQHNTHCTVKRYFAPSGQYEQLENRMSARRAFAMQDQWAVRARKKRKEMETMQRTHSPLVLHGERSARTHTIIQFGCHMLARAKALH